MTNLTSSIQVSEVERLLHDAYDEGCNDGADVQQGLCGYPDWERTRAYHNLQTLAMRSKDHSIAVDDVREWKPHLDYAGEPMREGEFRDPPPVGDDVREALTEARRYVHETITTRSRREIMLAKLDAVLTAIGSQSIALGYQGSMSSPEQMPYVVEQLRLESEGDA